MQCKSEPSPLARGTLGRVFQLIDNLRFIPAYAGNSLGEQVVYNKEMVHPRLRGELVPLPELILAVVGSSPLTRGTHSPEHLPPFGSRFIPAYAGNSSLIASAPGIHRVHPRLRGELRTEVTTANLESGSSPLTRGTHIKRLCISRTERFIPAYAGNSLKMVTTLH